MNATGPQMRGERVTSVVESEIHEPRIFTSIPPARLDGIDVHARAEIAKHKLLRFSSVFRAL